MPRCIAGLASPSFLPRWRPCRSKDRKWVVPRTADGRPDLEGVWENNSATPLERPPQLADKPRLTDEELASLEGARAHGLAPTRMLCSATRCTSRCSPKPAAPDSARPVPTARTGCRIATSSIARR